MRYALISDIHANLPALTAVLGDIERRGVDATFHPGDLVGYAPWPNEVVAALRDAGIAGAAGNYDSTVATGYRHCGCRSDNAHQEALSHESFTWTLANTSPGSKRWLAGLPFRLDFRPLGGHVAGPAIRLVHGSHALNTVYVTEERSDDFLAKMGDAMDASPGDVVCFGHTHRPWRRTVGGIHFVNTGSVGRPKDGDPRAGYVVLVVTEHGVGVEFVRVAYDVEAAARVIVGSGLPAEFGDFLRHGGGELRQPTY